MQCKNGTFYFEKFVVYLLPGSTDTLVIKILGLQDNFIPKKFISEPLQIGVVSRKCIAGEEQTKAGTCNKCPYGFYLLNPPDRQLNCKECMTTATCYGEDRIAPIAGYFRHSLTSDTIMECYNEKACLGGDEENLLGKCSKGYRGYMCGSCDANHVPMDQGTCKECRSRSALNIRAAVRVISITVLVLGILAMQFRMAEQDDGGHFAQLVALTKQVINHCIITAAISQVSFDWSENLDWVIQAQGVFVRYFSRYFDFNCFINGSSGLKGGGFDTIYNHLLYCCLSPLIFIAWFTLLFCVIGFVRRSFKNFKDKMISMIILVFWLLHSDICHAVFASFTCADPFETGE